MLGWGLHSVLPGPLPGGSFVSRPVGLVGLLLRLRLVRMMGEGEGGGREWREGKRGEKDGWVRMEVGER